MTLYLSDDKLHLFSGALRNDPSCGCCDDTDPMPQFCQGEVGSDFWRSQLVGTTIQNNEWLSGYQSGGVFDPTLYPLPFLFVDPQVPHFNANLIHIEGWFPDTPSPTFPSGGLSGGQSGFNITRKRCLLTTDNFYVVGHTHVTKIRTGNWYGAALRITNGPPFPNHGHLLFARATTQYKPWHFSIPGIECHWFFTSVVGGGHLINFNWPTSPDTNIVAFNDASPLAYLDWEVRTTITSAESLSPTNFLVRGVNEMICVTAGGDFSSGEVPFAQSTSTNGGVAPYTFFRWDIPLYHISEGQGEELYDICEQWYTDTGPTFIYEYANGQPTIEILDQYIESDGPRFEGLSSIGSAAFDPVKGSEAP